MLLWPSQWETSVIGMPWAKLGGRGVAVPQRVRDELRRQPGLPGGALKVLLIGAAGHVFVPASLEQVPVLGGAVVRDVLVDRLGHVQRQGDVAELPLDPELQRL